MVQEDNSYRFTSEINYLGDLIGADLPRDLLKTGIVAQDVPLDVSKEPVPTQPAGFFKTNTGATIGGGGTHQTTLRGLDGTTTISGRVDRTKAYDLTLNWKDTDGNTVFSDTLADNATGTVTLNETVITPRATLTVKDQASKTASVSYAIYPHR